jgi:hypothetical protein
MISQRCWPCARPFGRRAERCDKRSRCGSRPSPRAGVEGVARWWGILGVLALIWLTWVRLCGKPKKGDQVPSSIRVPPLLYRRPDPLIYSQTFLAEQGLAVTWNNPDIHLELDGKEVPSHELQPETVYEVVARIWNGSNEAPAIGLPVRFSYLDFGIGTVSHAIGEKKLDLPVKGAPGLPAVARMDWKTPKAGHYCLQVQLVWADDANAANNLGQENTDVKALNSPRSAFLVPVRNNTTRRQSFTMHADAYQMPARLACPPQRDRRPTDEEKERLRQQALRHHRADSHSIPVGWEVTVAPRELLLEADEQQDVTVEVTAPDGFRGRQSFNLNAFAGSRLTGGVTLTVEGTGE